MIAVEIPAALAERPEVVPVDRLPICPTCRGTAHVPTDLARGRFVHCEACGESGRLSLVGQRVALAWRETCPTCKGTGHYVDDRGEVYEDACVDDDCTDGSRMVVGWTAEVAEVLRVYSDVDPEFVQDEPFPCVSVDMHGVAYIWRGPDVEDVEDVEDGEHLSPGQYALVLRDARKLAATMTCDWCGQAIFWGFPAPSDPCPECERPVRMPTTCRPFTGYAELGDVL